jgi:hypothetical protein
MATSGQPTAPQTPLLHEENRITDLSDKKIATETLIE